MPIRFLRWLIALLPLLTLGCALNRSGGVDNPLRLCIENATAAYGNLFARVESSRYAVRPGQTLCRTIRPVAALPRLTASTAAAGLVGGLRFATLLPPSGDGCWHWLVSGREGEGALLPCRENKEL